ncbi:MAG TPA: chemotaxis protein CheB [Casimicrobiaceae bacterium]|nr:chemotaxis protein CheB [Casimicrobiaceae bacterium]
MNEAPLTPPPGHSDDMLVVGLGASAGGLAPLIEFFERVPVDSGIAFVVVVHLSPEHQSRLPELLQQATKMPVHAVKDSVHIHRGHIYVIAPKSQLRIFDGKLESTEPARRHGTMTIDVFLETLAAAHEHRAVGIILSGTGSDGTLGVRAIKARGGITLAQAPEEAEYDGMPRSAIASGVVDFVLPVRDMPERIVTLWRNAQTIRMPDLPDRPTPEDAVVEAEEAVRDVLATLRTRTGHDFSQYKRATLMRRLERRLQVNQLRSVVQYRDYINEHPGEAQALLRDLLISVTWFFRDPLAWQALEQHVIPDIVAGSSSSVRIWVVGCATGEEVYTLAMLLQEKLDGMADPPVVNLFATDIDEEALAFARAGLYPESIAEQVAPERLRRFFTRESGSYRVQKQLREMVMFAAHNVIQDAPFSRLDLVCCRNLLIYLTRHLQTKVLDLLHFALRADGYLFLGMSESVEDGHDGFTAIDKTNRIFAQQPRARMGLMLASLPMIQPQRFPADAGAAGRRMVSFTELHQRLLEHYAPPSIVVDDRYDVVHLSDRAGHFLQLGPGEPSLNLMKVLPEVLRYELKAALDQAMDTMRTVGRDDMRFERGSQVVRLDMKVHPVRDKASARTFALIIFDEVSAEERADAIVVGTSDAAAAEAGRLEERVREMEAQLRAAIEQYEVQNEELKASNEELQATNEELRATTEELETGKEELQSINEELVTVNQELKNKVDETTRISDDLTNFVTATGIASLFVDREMRLMRYTPFARDIFNLIPTDINRPLSDITHRLEGIRLEEGIEEVYSSLQVVEREARSTDGNWYIVRFLPYRTTDDRIRGAVLTFIDITQRRTAEAERRRSEAWARLVVESVREYAIITTDGTGKVRTWNPGARNIFGYEDAEIIGEDIAMLFTPEDRAAGMPADEMRRARTTGRAEDDRWQLRKDGSRFFASGILAPIEDADAFGYVKVLRDLTAQKVAGDRQQDQLSAERVSRSAAEEANRLKDEFLAMLSHELRNPLALMLMQAEILLRAPESRKSERLKQAAKVIHEMVRAQAQLVQDMLDVSRARTGKLTIDRQLLPLTFVVADSIGALRREAEEKNITLDVQTGDAQLIVAADPVRVRQIAWNLLNNALKFTPPGGTIHVRVSQQDGDYARLDVEDTGQGISPEAMPHIFDWFRRACTAPVERQGGMGIGLALVRQLVELHDGRVEAFSAGVGKGARFSVWLPLHVAAPVTDSQALSRAGERRRLAGLRILIVDDVAANGDALRDLLQYEGADATVESLPAKAIERVENEEYGLIISDIAMPDVDGYAMIKAIRASTKNKHTPAIAYSGYGGANEVQRAHDAGFDRHLTKPIDVESLLTSISEVTRDASVK